MTKYGFIGLGSQGAPMARRMIDAGLPVVLWARRPQTLEPFADTSAEIAGSIAELGSRVEYVGICVVDDAGVREVCNQLIPAMKPGGRIVIHSTIHPELCRQLAIQAAEHALELVDAPVSGGGQSAADKALTVMLGGDTQTVEAVRPVLETFSGLIVHLGSVGAGQMAKLVNNTMMAANLATAYHGLESARVLGIDRDAFVELVRASSGRSFSFDVAARLSSPAEFLHGAKLLHKDVGLLGEAVGGTSHYKSLSETANSFLGEALK